MVSVSTLALLTTLAMQVVSQPPGIPQRFQPGKTLLPQSRSTGKCSIPLVNAFQGMPRPEHWKMPVIRPGKISRMPIVEPPAPPCSNWPPR